MARGKSDFAAAKPDKSFFQEKAKVAAPTQITDKPSTGPAPVKVAPVSMVTGYANAANSGLAQTSHINTLTVWKQNAARSQVAQPTVSHPGSFTNVAAGPAPGSIPAFWKVQEPKKKSNARKTSSSSNSAKSLASMNSSQTSAPLISPKGPKPVPANNKKPSWPFTLTMVAPKGVPAPREPSKSTQPSDDFMTAAALREIDDAKVLNSAAFGCAKKTQESRRSTTSSSSVSSPEAAKPIKAIEQPEATPAPAPYREKSKATTPSKSVKKPTSPTKKSSANNGPSIKLAGNGGAAHLLAPILPASSSQPAKATAITKKSYSDMVATVSSAPSDKAEKEANALAAQPKTTQQLVATEKKSQRKNKKGVKSTDTAATLPISTPKTADFPKKTDHKKVDVKDATHTKVDVTNTLKNGDKSTPVATPAVASNVGSVSVSAETTQLANDVSTPTLDDAVLDDFAQDAAAQSDAQDASATLKKARKNKKSGAQRKKEKKVRTPEEAASIAAAKAAAARVQKIPQQIAIIKGLAESDAADRELPMDVYDLQDIADRDEEDVMALNKQRAEESLRKSLHANAAKPDGERVMIKNLPSYMWYFDACAQPILQGRAAKILKVMNATSLKATAKQMQMAKEKDMKMKLAIADDQVPKTWNSILPENGFNFGTSSLSGHSIVSVLSPVAASYDFGNATDTPIVFGASTALPEIEKLEPTKLETIELEVTESESIDLESTELDVSKSTASIVQVIETSESDDTTTDTDTSLASEEESSPIDDESKPVAIQDKIFEPLAATTENLGSFKTGTALVLAVADEESYAESKINEPYMAVAIYHGFGLPVVASAPPASPDKIALEMPQIALTTEDLKAFAPALPRPVFGPFFARKTVMDIPLQDSAIRLVAYIGTLRHVPDGLPANFHRSATPAHEPAQLERTVTVYTAPQAVPIVRRPDNPHRIINTQIGIVMLGEFLRQLHSPVAPTYTIMELVEAFLAMSNFERVFLDVGAAHPYSAIQVRNYKHLQSRVMIGSIKLCDFLAAMKLNDDGDVTLRALVNGWEACAVEDVKAEDLHMQVKEAIEEANEEEL
ncbi:hypothetical protein HBI06_024150 [Parastagonospora nodorum]|nr:hypothetical protein HBI05_231650 [Parastagonospora nodorum]KAH4240024.1 hypothetical protein HBI06_024150 [Parastagonospora nodorum]